MKRFIIGIGAIALGVIGLHGQGQFLFNTHDPASGVDIRFFITGAQEVHASGPDIFVEVLAGPDQRHLVPLTPLLALNRTGAEAGYTSPFAQIYTTSMPGGTTAFVGYRMFQGTSWEAAPYVKTDTIMNVLGLGLTPLAVPLTTPPNVPYEVQLGVSPLITMIPEPRVWPLLLLGAGGILCRVCRTRFPGRGRT